MGKMKAIYTEIMSCDLCQGRGWLFAGDKTDYDVESCICNPYEYEIN